MIGCRPDTGRWIGVCRACGAKWYRTPTAGRARLGARVADYAIAHWPRILLWAMAAGFVAWWAWNGVISQ